MGASRCAWLAVGMALAAAAGLSPERAHAETPETAPPAADAPSAARPAGEDSPAVYAPAPAILKPTLAPPDCADRPDVLGLSRIVEIDTATAPRFGDQYKKVEPQFLEEGEVVLTFDDGPMRRYTLPILDVLDEQCTKATFFSVGRMAVADPATLQEIARRGHTLGTHTWSHKNLGTLGADAMKREVELGLSAVALAAGQPVAPFFRFPYLGHGKASLAYMETRGLGIFGIHVDSRDFRTKNPGTVLRTVLAGLERDRRGILLFHDIQPSTAGALASLLEELKARGFKVVHMVPKEAVTTLPEFDAIAEKALKGKSVAASKEPLATRAVTWPVSGDETDAAAGPPPPKSKAPRTPAARPYDWANPSNDPWQLKVFGD